MAQLLGEPRSLAAIHAALTARIAGDRQAVGKAALRLSLILGTLGGASSFALLPILGSVAAVQGLLASSGLSFLLHRAWTQLPKTLERKRWLDAAPAVPRLVALLAMGLRTRGSLDHAVALVAKRGPAPFAREFGQMRWEAAMGAPGVLEQRLAERAFAWGIDHPELKAALRAILIAANERSLEGIRRSVDRAEAVALQGSRRRLEEFSASLMGPTTALFALGVLLPLVLGALLPLTLVSAGLDFNPTEAHGPTLGLVGDLGPTVLLLNGIFPSAAFAYAWLILLHRPAGEIAEAGPASRPSPRTASAAVATSIAGASLPLLVLGGLAGSAAALCGAALPLATYALIVGRRQREEAQARGALLEELPDALFVLGSRLASGEPLLRALRGYAHSCADRPLGRLFSRVLREVAFGQRDLAGALSAAARSSETAMSPAVGAALETIAELAERDETVAGALLLEFGQGLGELRRVERESALRLAQVTQMMGWTSSLFAPLTLGLTVGLYSSLVGAFGDLPGPGSALPVGLLLFVLGAYLLELGGVIHFFLCGLRGTPPWARLDLLGGRLLCSVLVFLATALASLRWLAG